MFNSRSGASGDQLIGLIDVGSSKVCCMIVHVAAAPPGATEPAVRLVGFGHQRSLGVKAGVIVDLDEAERAVRATINQAERMAGVAIETVVAAVACGRLKSQRFSATVDITAPAVTSADIGRAIDGAERYLERDGRRVVHITRHGYRLDGMADIRDPRGMAGQRLAVDLHAVSADEAPLRNLLLLIERCHLATDGLAVAAMASGLAVTTPEERAHGVTCIDIGAGTMLISMFEQGRFCWTDALPVGGNHITYDVARALATPLAEAERIKTLYGTMTLAASDDHQQISFPRTGDGETHLYQVSRTQLRDVIRPRLGAMMAMASERIEAARVGGFAGGYAARRVVLTGGGSQLAGLAEYAAGVLQRPVRIGRANAGCGLPPSASSPAFATINGLLVARLAPEGGLRGIGERSVLASGYVGRVQKWLKESF